MLKSVLTPEDVARIIEAAPILRDKVVIRLLSRLGCRVSELISIRASDIDFTNGLVAIQHLKQNIRKTCPKCHFKVGKKHNFCPHCGTTLKNVSVDTEVRRRLIPVDGKTLEMVKEYLNKRRINSNKVIPLTRQMVYYIVRKAAQRAGLGGAALFITDGKGAPGLGTGRHYVHPHSFRDALAVRWLTRRRDPEGQKALQEHLGHKNFNTTMRYFKMAVSGISDVYKEVFEEE
jgi:integrase/recombinase XerD